MITGPEKFANWQIFGSFLWRHPKETTYDFIHSKTLDDMGNRLYFHRKKTVCQNVFPFVKYRHLKMPIFEKNRNFRTFFSFSDITTTYGGLVAAIFGSIQDQRALNNFKS